MVPVYSQGLTEKEAYMRVVRRQLKADQLLPSSRFTAASNVFLRSKDNPELPTLHGFPITLVRCAELVTCRLPEALRRPFVLHFLAIPNPGTDLAIVWPSLAIWMNGFFAVSQSKAVMPHIRELTTIITRLCHKLASKETEEVDWRSCVVATVGPQNMCQYDWLFDGSTDDLPVRIVTVMMTASRVSCGDDELFAKAIKNKLLALMQQ